MKKVTIRALISHQERTINALRIGNDVFVWTKTGSGKSLIYECAPLVYGETGVTTILAPLNSIITEQRLQQLGCRATYITAETDREAVMNGYYQFLLSSPRNSGWRSEVERDIESRTVFQETSFDCGWRSTYCSTVVSIVIVRVLHFCLANYYQSACQIINQIPTITIILYWLQTLIYLENDNEVCQGSLGHK